MGVGMTFAPGGLTRPGLDGPPAWLSVLPGSAWGRPQQQQRLKDAVLGGPGWVGSP